MIGPRGSITQWFQTVDMAQLDNLECIYLRRTSLDIRDKRSVMLSNIRPQVAAGSSAVDGLDFLLLAYIFRRECLAAECHGHIRQTTPT